MMKHLQTYGIFESSTSEETLKRDSIRKMLRDDTIAEWLKTCDFNDGGEPEVMDRNKITTPYGETFTAELPEDMGDFDGEGYNYHAIVTDKYRMLYGVEGYSKGLDYDDPQPEYEYDGYYCWFEMGTDLHQLILDQYKKFPVVMIKIFSYLSPQEQEKLLQDIPEGDRSLFTKSSRVLNRMGL